MTLAGSTRGVIATGFLPVIASVCLAAPGAFGGEPARFSTLGRPLETGTTNRVEDTLEDSGGRLKLGSRMERGSLGPPPAVSLSINPRQRDEMEQRRNWIFMRPSDVTGRSSTDASSGERLTLRRNSSESFDPVMDFLARRQEQRNAPLASSGPGGSLFGTSPSRTDEPFQNLIRRGQAESDAVRLGANPGTLGTAAALLDVLSPRRRAGLERTPEQQERMTQFKALLDAPALPRPIDGMLAPSATAPASMQSGVLPSARSLEDLTAVATGQTAAGTPLGGYGVLGSRAVPGALDDAAQRGAYANAVRESPRPAAPSQAPTDAPPPRTIPRRAF